jgi:protein-S-isoprenylcysteine O-methyltransferase Ste14
MPRGRALPGACLSGDIRIFSISHGKDGGGHESGRLLHLPDRDGEKARADAFDAALRRLFPVPRSAGDLSRNEGDAFFGLSRPLGYPWNLAVSLPLLAAGAFLWSWSVLHFAKARGTPVPVSPPPELVDTGPYAYVRNPMLSGIFLVLFGSRSLWDPHPSVCFFSGLYDLQHPGIQTDRGPELEKRLGEKYLDYKRRTPILIPKIFR